VTTLSRPACIISNVASAPTANATSGAMRRSVWPTPQPTSSACSLGSGAARAMSRSRSAPDACVVLVTYAAAVFPNCARASFHRFFSNSTVVARV
jgi:hypothetical protein